MQRAYHAATIARDARAGECARGCAQVREVRFQGPAKRRAWPRDSLCGAVQVAGAVTPQAGLHLGAAGESANGRARTHAWCATLGALPTF